MAVFILIGILYGIGVAVSLAILITVSVLKKSNDIGDSRGKFEDFSKYINYTYSEDNLRNYR